MWIDVSLAEVLVFGIFFGKHVKVDDRQTDVLAYLRGSKSHTIRCGERFKHVGNQFLEVGIFSVDINRHFAKSLLAVGVNG